MQLLPAVLNPWPSRKLAEADRQPCWRSCSSQILQHLSTSRASSLHEYGQHMSRVTASAKAISAAARRQQSKGTATDAYNHNCKPRNMYFRAALQIVCEQVRLLEAFNGN